MLKVTTITVQGLTIKRNKNYDHSLFVATELADYLARKGIPFRKAHHIVGQITAYALVCSKSLSQLSLSKFREFSNEINEDVYKVLTIESAINNKTGIGGTAVANVALAIAEINRDIENGM